MFPSKNFINFVGIIITSDEREETLTKGFALLKSILPNDAFFNSPSKRPSVIMTDNCDELHHALSYNWPDATLLLCTFHILQQVWRWLYQSSHGIAKNDRVTIMKLFREIVYAKDVEIYVAAYNDLFEVTN